MAINVVVRLYLIALVVFFAIDLTWLGLIARPFYAQHLGGLLREQALWPAAVLFYLLFLVGLIAYAVLPALRARASVPRSAAYGAAYGFITYQTYELTNWALIRDWPAVIVVVDILWGVVLAALVSASTVWIARHLLGVVGPTGVPPTSGS